MCAFNAALDFGKDMIELSASTLGQLIVIQLADLTTFLEHQSVAIYKVTEARDVAAVLALQREYREAFWKDRRAALTATRDTLQIASQVVAKSWNQWAAEGASTALPEPLPEKKPAIQRVRRKPAAVDNDPVAAATPALNASVRTKAQRAGAKIVAVASDTGHDAKQGAPRPIVKKRSVRSRKSPGGTRPPPTATR